MLFKNIGSIGLNIFRNGGINNPSTKRQFSLNFENERFRSFHTNKIIFNQQSNGMGSTTSQQQQQQMKDANQTQNQNQKQNPTTTQTTQKKQTNASLAIPGVKHIIPGMVNLIW